VAYGSTLAVFSAIEFVIAGGLWRPFDIASYYGLADPASKTVEAFMDFGARAPALAIDTGFSSAGRMLLVVALCLACSLLVMEAGRRLYGNAPGFLAGLLFTLNIAWVQGYMTIGESLALMLALCSVLTLLWGNKKYLVSGLSAGVAACFMPLALLLIPLSLIYMHSQGQRKYLAPYVFGALLPLLLAWLAVTLVYGDGSPSMAASSGFTAMGFTVLGEGYRNPDALLAIADIVLSVCLFTSLLPLALFAFPGREHGYREVYFLAAGLCFLISIPLGQYLHYWFFAMPFLVLLCVKAVGERKAEAEARGGLTREASTAGDISVTFK